MEPENAGIADSEGPTKKIDEQVMDATRVVPPDERRPHSPPTATSLLGVLGGYELLGEIARGGMGVVYRARDTRLNRLVALKTVLNAEFSSSEDLERFRVEAEAAAELNHPNIVPIHEVGVDGGRHYFSMRLVEGPSLAQEIPRLKADANRTAQLMVKVSRAVHYAHQRGILHRDLKPGNILLDEQGEPYVTDFGLAKRLEGDGGLTLTGAVMGTPQYMAPEQAAGKVRQLTTAADVYALGAILYHLLTGQPPFQGGSSVEILRQVLENDPKAPRLLVPGLDQDLESICLKCLEKEPGRRYGSAEDLAEDLERWLNHEPISARPITTMQRAVKWARRRPAIAGLAAAVVVVAVAGFGATLWQLRQANIARADAEQRAEAEARARKEADEAKQEALAASKRAADNAEATEAVNRFLIDDVIARGSPGSEIRPDVTVREAVAQAAAKIKDRFTNQPLVEAQIQRAVGWALMESGDWTGAPQHFRRAVALFASELGNENRITLSATVDLANALGRVQEYQEAEQLLKEVIALSRPANSHDMQGKSAEAPVGSPVSRSTSSTNTQDFFEASANHYLSAIAFSQGRVDESIRLGQRSLDLYKSDTYPNGHPVTAVALAHKLVTVDRLDEAETLLTNALSELVSSLGEKNMYALLASQGLGALYAKQGRLKEAETLLRKTLELKRSTLGDENPETVIATHSLANTLRQMGRREEAMELLNEALRVREKTLGKAHDATLRTLADLGWTCIGMKDYEAAERWFREAIGRVPPGGDRVIQPLESSRKGLVDTFYSQGREAISKKNFPLAEAKLLESWRLNEEIVNPAKAKSIATELVKLYNQTKDIAKVAEWQQRLGSLNTAPPAKAP